MSKRNRKDKIIAMAEHKPRAPLYEALVHYRKRKDASFHVPGHKDGQAYLDIYEEMALVGVMEIDATEITGTDDLHHPEGVIREAQQLAAEYFGAAETFFLVGGSTVGNLSLILSVCTAPGVVLLVQRNVHKSVIHGLMLAGANAVFLSPQIDAASGLATIPSVETVREALRRYPGAKGLLVTHPNYYGMGATLQPLAQLCHGSGVPLLVDEAHGAHFGLHQQLPPSALAQGADGVVQSTHKMLTAMTMGAMLHVQGGLLDRGLIRQRLAMVQSSSPSYPIMASLDLSRCLLQASGERLFAQALAIASRIRSDIKATKRFSLVELGASGDSAAYSIQDPFKVVLYDAAGELSGYALQEALEACGCIPEMSDERYVVLTLGVGTSQQDANRLLAALRETAEAHPSEANISTWNILDKPAASQPQLQAQDSSQSVQMTANVSAPVLFSLRPVAAVDIERIPVEESAGRQAAEMVIPYPPGIPILYPGEWITNEIETALIQLGRSKAKCQGVEDSSLRTINVYQSTGQRREHRES
ncbi:MAG TPA: aminotransferase class I/II-fold pyridoxal phosphate-dependent enzyme [Paenibacillus sp.]